MRRSYYFFPKLVLGKPTDAFIDKTSRWPLPRSRDALSLLVGHCASPSDRIGSYNLPAPDHDLFEAHPTACTLYLDHIVHGRDRGRSLASRGSTARRVHFVDGSERRDRPPRLRHRLPAKLPVHGSEPHSGRARAAQSSSSTPSIASIDDLFVVGLFEPAEGGVWQLADYQAKLVASFIVALASGCKARRGLVPQAEGERHAGYRPWHPLQGHALA